MKTEELKTLISNYVNEESFDMDMTSSVLKKIKSQKQHRKSISSRIILIAALVVLFSTVTYATVLKVIALHASTSETVKEIKITSSYDASDNIDPFEEFSETEIPTSLIGLPSMTINTDAPLRGRIRRGDHAIDTYDELTRSVNNTSLLAKHIDAYVFESALVNYDVIIPTDEDLLALAAKHSDEQFYTFELETRGQLIHWYEYQNENMTNATYTIQPTAYTGERSYSTDQIPEHEIVPLSTTEALLMIRDNMDFSNIGEDYSKDTIQNNYQILWQEETYEYLIRPSRSTRIYPDMMIRNNYSYPEHTKENLKVLALSINQFLNKD